MKKKHVVIAAAIIVILAAAAVSYLLFAEGSSGEALASVNGEKITVARFLQEVEKVAEPSRGMIKENPAEFLDMMIMKALVLQEAKKKGFLSGEDEDGEERTIESSCRKFQAPPAVTKDEIEGFYG